MITAVVGSGGKTTLIHNLANAYRKEGKRVLVTTTTHMYQESDTLITDDPEVIMEQLSKNQYVFVGNACKDSDCKDIEIPNSNTIDSKNKITALSTQTLQTLIEKYSANDGRIDEILIEADGSKGLPLKMPNSTEPVMPEETDKVIVVSSLLALDKPAKNVIHRLKLALPVLDIQEDTLITAEHIQTLLQKGYLKSLMKQSFETEIHITHDGSLYQRALASLLTADMDVDLLHPDWFASKPSLFICGAGHVAKELSDIATFLDFEITVMDSRAEFANKERFPNVNVICDSFENLSNYIGADNTYYVVVTPGHQDDYTSVKQILNQPYTYLGMIGSRKKIAATYDRLQAEGYTKEQLDTIHAPIGLSIGATTPAEIAISILAEIIEEKSKHTSASISKELLHTKETGTLCIIIEKTGSSPRGVGSMMLVTKDGQIDSIGGGAVEHQVIVDAKAITKPCIKEYDLGPADASKLGMICGGTNKILFIPI